LKSGSCGGSSASAAARAAASDSSVSAATSEQRLTLVHVTAQLEQLQDRLVNLVGLCGGQKRSG
jgi:hypothetical protein